MEIGSVDGVLSIKDDFTATFERAAQAAVDIEQKFNQAADAIAETASRQSASINETVSSYDAAAAAAKKHTDDVLANSDAVVEAYDAYQKLAAALSPVEAASQQYANAVEVLNNALEKGIITQEKYEQQMEAIKDRQEEASHSAEHSENSFGHLALEIAGAVGIWTSLEMALEGVKESLEFVVESVVQADRVDTILAATVKATGERAGLTANELKDLAHEVSESSSNSRIEVEKSEQVLLRYADIHGDVFKRIIKVSADVAVSQNSSIEAMSQKIGTALQFPERASRMLRQLVDISPALQSQLKEMVSSGDKAGAVEIILSKLEATSKGLAETEAGTLSGSWKVMKNTAEELAEQVGEAGLAGAMHDLAMSVSAITKDESLATWAHIIGAGLKEIYDLLKASAAVWGVFSGPAEMALGAVVAAIGLVLKGLSYIVPSLKGAAKAVIDEGTSLMSSGLDKLKGSVTGMATAFEDMKKTAEHAFDGQEIDQALEAADRMRASMAGAAQAEQKKADEKILREKLEAEKAAEKAAKEKIEFDATVAKNAAEIAGLNAVAAAQEQGALAVEMANAANKAAMQLVEQSKGKTPEQIKLLKEQNDQMLQLAKAAILKKSADEAMAAAGKALDEQEKKAVERKKEVVAENNKWKQQLDALHRDAGQRQRDIEAETDALYDQIVAQKQSLEEQQKAEAHAMAVEAVKANPLIDEQAYEAAALRLIQLRDHAAEIQQKFEDVASAFSLIGQAAGGKMGQIIGDMGSLVSAIGKVTTAANGMQKAFAAAAAVNIGASILKDLGVGALGKTGGVSALGGRLESNYAGIGSVVGTIIGAIIGAITSYGANTAGGAALGGAIGGLIGGMISKAGDSASAMLLSDGNVVVGESSAKLDGAVSDALHKIFDGVNTALAGLGLSGGSGLLGGIDIKVRDNIIRVIIGGLVRTFSSMQDAVSFAMTEALKQFTAAGGTSSTVPAEVIQAIKGSHAEDLQSLQADIDFAKHIAYYGLPPIVEQIDKTVAEYFTNMQHAQQLGIDTTKVTQEFVDKMQQMRDSILGIDKKLSPEEQIRRDAAAFNTKVTLLKADWAIKQADLEQSRNEIAGKAAALQAKGVIATTDAEIEVESLKAKGMILQGQGAILQGLLTQLSTIDDAIAAMKNITLPDIISEQEIQDAIRRLQHAGSGAGGGGLTPQQEVKQFIADKRESFASDFKKQIDEINKSYDEQAKKLKATDPLLKQLNDLRAQELKLLGEQIKRDLINPFVGRPGQRSGLSADLADVMKQYDDARKNHKALGLTIWQLNQAETERLHIMGLQAAANAGSKTAATILQFQDLAQTIDFLRMNAVALGVDFDKLMTELQNEQFLSIGDELIGFVEKYYGTTAEGEALKLKLEKVRFDLEIANLKLQAQLALTNKLLTQEQFDSMKTLFDYIDTHAPNLGGNPPGMHWDGTGWVGDGWGSPSGGTGAPDDNAMQQALDKLAKYEDMGTNPLILKIREINKDFSALRLVLGDTTRVQAAYMHALQATMDEALKPYKDMLQSLTTSDLSPATTLDKINEAKDNFFATVAQIQGGDLTHFNDLPGMLQNLLQLAQGGLPIGSQAYQQIFAAGNAALQAIVAQFGSAVAPQNAPDLISASNIGQIGSALSVSNAPVVDAIEFGAGQQVIMLQKVADATTASASSLTRIESRMDDGLLIRRIS